MKGPVTGGAGILRWLRHVRASSCGVSTIEFALVAPVFMVVLLGLFDMAHQAYANAILNGAVQDAARTSSLETGNTTVADAKVRASIDKIIAAPDFTSSRKSYLDFSDVGRAEKWNDANSNGTCDNKESYTDENGNGGWDDDIGVSGNGGANDVVIYTVEVKYTAPFAMPLVPGSMNQRTLSASAVKKNQPFAFQRGYGSKAGTCD